VNKISNKQFQKHQIEIELKNLPKFQFQFLAQNLRKNVTFGKLI